MWREMGCTGGNEVRVMWACRGRGSYRWGEWSDEAGVAGTPQATCGGWREEQVYAQS